MEEARLRILQNPESITDQPNLSIRKNQSSDAVDQIPPARLQNTSTEIIPSQQPQICMSEPILTPDHSVHIEIQSTPPQSTLNPEAQPFKLPAVQNDFTALGEALAASLNLSRLPIPEPTVFSGQPLDYPDWKASFATLIESRGIPAKEKIHYLKRYLGGPAREAVSGYFLLNSESAFERAKKVLDERYGCSFAVSEAFRNKLDAWPNIPPRDGKALRRFSDFLQQCETAMSDIKDLDILNDNRENKKMLRKLPDWLVTRWARQVAESKRVKSIYPNFDQFVKFIMTEADIACDPVTSLEALRGKYDKPKDSKTIRSRTPGVTTFATGGQTKIKEKSQPVKKCLFCKRDYHNLQECRAFSSKPMTEKHEFIQKSGLCYGCLCHGHMSKDCKDRSTCKRCSRRHPTCLHMDQKPTKVEKVIEKPKEEETAEKTSLCSGLHTNREQVSSMVVPVWVSSKQRPNSERLVYALLDTQSDTTFILDETCEKIGAESVPIQLRLTTMTAKSKIIQSRKLNDLVVRGYDSTEKISLPTAYTREHIPVNISHIPTPDTANRWPHLKGISHKIQQLQKCEVGLLIGYSCPQALAPRNCITGEGNQPFAVETVLGWSIIGRLNLQDDTDNQIGMSHRIITRPIDKGFQLSSINQQSSSHHVQFVCNTKGREEIIHINFILESDFLETQNDETCLSQKDLQFLKIVEHIHQDKDGYYSMPLPFDQGRPNLPNNRYMAKKRLDHLKRRFDKDEKYFKDYKKFIEDILHKGDAERIPQQELEKENVWYIPHHGVYHPKKPDKIRVVFDCSAKYRNTSINDHLLQGPDLINTLTGVLCRFRQEPVTFMCDIERMYHQFRVDGNDQDYLRFLWWPDSDIQNEEADFRMKVHLFGAASSPGCANYGLKKVANDYSTHCGMDAANFIINNFYVDDGLKSTATIDSAIRLIKDSRNLCSKGNLRLHKFISNSREVMASIPQSNMLMMRRI